MKRFIAGQWRAWVTLIGLLVVLMAAANPIAQPEPIRIKVNAVNTVGDHLKVNVSGNSFTTLTGTARLRTAPPFSEVIELNIDTSVLVMQPSIPQFFIFLGDSLTTISPAPGIRIFLLFQPPSGLPRLSFLHAFQDGRDRAVFDPFSQPADELDTRISLP